MQSYIAVKTNGRIVNVGVPNRMQSLDLRAMFDKNLTVTAMYPGNRDSFLAMCAFMEDKGLRPVVERVLPFSEGKTAFEAMGGIFGKTVIHVNDMPEINVEGMKNVNRNIDQHYH